jgi:hypothetical protein
VRLSFGKRLSRQKSLQVEKQPEAALRMAISSRLLGRRIVRVADA